MTTTREPRRPDAKSDRRTSDRRSGRTRVHFPERRSGFDRRTDPGAGPRRIAYLAWIRRISGSPWRAAVLMGSIVALNVADVAFTLRALARGLEEVNPVMAGLLDAGHGLAAVVKVGVATVLATGGWWFRRYRRVIEVALAVVAVMSLVVVYHLLTFSLSA